jgi:hypothetical protein
MILNKISKNVYIFQPMDAQISNYDYKMNLSQNYNYLLFEYYYGDMNGI